MRKIDKIKVIFLDIDGVLNNKRTIRRTGSGYKFVGKRHIENLKRIVDETGAKIVLSSDWRHDRDNPAVNGDFLELKKELMRYGIHFYGFTPELQSNPFCTGHRGEEINQWLKEHNEVDNFVILDDRTDIEPNKDHWVRTMMKSGLGKEETEKAIKILNEQKYMLSEICLCKDCIYRDGTIPGQPNILCGQMKDDDFCSYGQRE